MESRAIAKAPEGEGCPRCGGYVYAAEQMLARGKVSMPAKIQMIQKYRAAISGWVNIKLHQKPPRNMKKKHMW